jgi:glycosyltransferase involved in cell wall biosynthesis
MKPSVLFVCDTKWAWYYKSLQIKKHLSDEFDMDIICLLDGDKVTDGYDLYFTYGYSYIDALVKAGVPYEKRITGLTAHRDRSIIEPQMKKAFATHANSILLYNYLKTIHNNAFYIPNGVDEELFKPITSIPLHSPNITVGHVAKEHPLKGHNDYVKPSIQKSGADYIYHHSNHINKIPHEQMVNLYQEMDCFIVASIEDGTPNPAFEAAACARPIISNRIGNMPEFIKNGYNGFLLEERNIDEYVDRILWFRDHREEMIQMGLNARKTIEEGWTWKIQAENYRRMLRRSIV